jgi:DNA-binding XRE family transcriptional regulator
MATAATQAQAALRARGNLDRAGLAEVIDLSARRRLALERDDSDPELWLDDGVMGRAPEVSRWPA